LEIDIAGEVEEDIRVEEVHDQDNVFPNNAPAAAAPAPNVPRVRGGGGADGNNANNVNNVNNVNVNADGNWGVRHELVLGTESANFVAGALVFPAIVASMGSLVGRIPGIRKILPERFHRNIFGGCLFVLLKDLFTLYYKYKRAKQRKTRSILNYPARRGKAPEAAASR